MLFEKKLQCWVWYQKQLIIPFLQPFFCFFNHQSFTQKRIPKHIWAEVVIWDKVLFKSYFNCQIDENVCQSFHLCLNTIQLRQQNFSLHRSILLTKPISLVKYMTEQERRQWRRGRLYCINLLNCEGLPALKIAIQNPGFHLGSNTDFWCQWEIYNYLYHQSVLENLFLFSFYIIAIFKNKHQYKCYRNP